MIYYIINGLFIGVVSIFEYRRYKLIQSLKKIDNGIYANYTSKGWHHVDNPSVKWDIFYTLKEVAKSNDGNKIKFEVVDIESGQPNFSSFDKERYEKKFYAACGGWLDINHPNLFFFGESKSIWEERNRKLEALGIK
jgi:hypothetical protein